MIVVADTSPLHYLVLAGEVQVLPQLFQQVLIPREVCEELTHIGAIDLIRRQLLSRARQRAFR